MPYVTSVERIGIRKGIEKGLKQGLQQGLQKGLLRQINKRFGAEVAERSEPLLARIDDPQCLEDLGEVLLDSINGESWLAALQEMLKR